MSLLGNLQVEVYGGAAQVIGVDYAIEVGDAEHHLVGCLFDRDIVDVLDYRFGLGRTHEESGEGSLLLVELLDDELERFAVGRQLVHLAGNQVQAAFAYAVELLGSHLGHLGGRGRHEQLFGVYLGIVVVIEGRLLFGFRFDGDNRVDLGFGVDREQQAVFVEYDVAVATRLELHEVLLFGVGYSVGVDLDRGEAPRFGVLGDGTRYAQVFLGILVVGTRLADGLCGYDLEVEVGLRQGEYESILVMFVGGESFRLLGESYAGREEQAEG